jgi:CRP-like cAMP-binding protein
MSLPLWVIPMAPPRERPRPALFEGMPDDDVRAILSHATVGDYPAQSWLYRQGEPATEFFLVQSGLVRLRQMTEEGDNILVRFIAPGEVFGYFSLALGALNVVSAHAIQPCRVAVWDQTTALQLLQTVPRAALNLFNIAAHDVAYSYDRTCRLVTNPVRRRVQWALAELVRTIGVHTPQGGVIALAIGQRDLAEFTDTNIFTVSRELGKLECQGVIERGRGRIVVLQPAKLLEKW